MSEEYDFSIIKEDCELLAKRVDVDFFRNRKIMIIGANGLIGGFLADFFNFLNEEYSCKINLVLSSYSERESAKRIRHLLSNENISYFSWDCSNPLDSRTDKHLSGIDDVYFCAGYGQPAKFLKDAIKTTLINIIGVKSILERLSKNEKVNFLFLSSSEVYANPPQECIPTSEEYSGCTSLDNNRACYIQSKKTGEVLCHLYNQMENMNVKSARVALAYGPGVLRSDQRVMQNFIFKANDGAINMLDEGKSIRNYLYISDCVEILINILHKGKHQIYNVGGDSEEIDILDLANKIASTFDVDVIIPPMEDPLEQDIISAPNKVSLDMARYREEFPSYGENIIFLDKGLKKLIKWFKMV